MHEISGLPSTKNNYKGEFHESGKASKKYAEDKITRRQLKWSKD
jgi:hypothetical protein